MSAKSGIFFNNIGKKKDRCFIYIHVCMMIDPYET